MPNGMFVLVPIMVLGIGVTWIISASMLKIQRLRMEEAKLRVTDDGPLNDLAHQVADLQQELGEVQERLDFAERMLAQGKETSGLPAPRPNE